MRMKRESTDWLVGSPAPALSLPSASDGALVTLSQFEGRPVLVTFLSHAA